MKLCPARDFRLPYQSDILVLVASTMSSVAPWKLCWPSHDPSRHVPVKDIIADLDFKNPRTTEGKSSGFICLPPHLEVQQPSSKVLVYNHETGHPEPWSATPLQWNNEKVDALTTVPKLWSHPSKYQTIPNTAVKVVLKQDTDFEKPATTN